MNRFLIAKILIICISLKLITATFEYEWRDRTNRGILDSDKESRRANRRGTIKDLLQKLKAKMSRKSSESSGLHGLAKNLEVILSKVIPNHNLVQDLLGYVTMPRLMRDRHVPQYYHPHPYNHHHP